MPWKLCAGHGAADVGPPRPRSCGHVATKTLNQCVFERHAAVRHERAVPAYGSFLFRDDLKPSPTGTSPCSHGAETCLDDAMSKSWRRSGQSVTASDFGSNGPRFESGRGRCVESLDKALYSLCPKEKPSH